MLAPSTTRLDDHVDPLGASLSKVLWSVDIVGLTRRQDESVYTSAPTFFRHLPVCAATMPHRRPTGTQLRGSPLREACAPPHSLPLRCPKPLPTCVVRRGRRRGTAPHKAVGYDLLVAGMVLRAPLPLCKTMAGC